MKFSLGNIWQRQVPGMFFRFVYITTPQVVPYKSCYVPSLKCTVNSIYIYIYIVHVIKIVGNEVDLTPLIQLLRCRVARLRLPLTIDCSYLISLLISVNLCQAFTSFILLWMVSLGAGYSSAYGMLCTQLFMTVIRIFELKCGR
jgi:hypothetical protein